MTLAYKLSAHAFAFATMLLAEGLGFKPQEFPNSFWKKELFHTWQH